ncbi:uncharacterized protein LOC126747859 isoform X1 [Anthonomus grandis grandis]|uniref:uncharacterized protein LOC126747859 isoform X1 n=1 Tax=Anthonomus grandis grandis TaxID=2921223 RepID=UPI0021666D42|nr:uncharacterized protein LOC126747859 isoform X1 [Anthonomus grandis grandis]
MRTTVALLRFPIFLLLFQLQHARSNTGGRIPGMEAIMPRTHVALSGDLQINIVSESFLPLVVQLSRLEGTVVQPLTAFPVYPEASALRRNLTLVQLECGYFSKGGQYYVQIRKQPIVGVNASDSETLTRVIDVRWPTPQLTVTPENVKTYPEGPVTTILTFPEVKCPPKDALLSEFSLQLFYCGHSLLNCDEGLSGEEQNRSSYQVLYYEQVRGLPGRKVVEFRCELFGLSGHYAIFLRPSTADPLMPRGSAYVKVDWSDQFVFNVHARSIFPCDTHSGGVTVLFQYPSCILATGDRVRLFARLRANVASLAPPTTLEYVAEQKVERGHHSLHFGCDLFSERYVEYCFVYVSQSISGAVADVREDCVPTLPVSDQERGGWSAWSRWTPCSSTCAGGIRSRYRLCDSPPPKYGAKFCEGSAVETERCGIGLGITWECLYNGGLSNNNNNDNSLIPANIPEVKEEVGPYCRCGCVVHLGVAKPNRKLATSSQSCPGRIFWLIQADDECIIHFIVKQFNLPCGNQWLKVRDGSSLSSRLLADLEGEPGSMPATVNSTGPNLLLEFYSDDISVGNLVCDGGFVAEASQLKVGKSNVTALQVVHAKVIPMAVLKMTAVHFAALFFLAGLVLATLLLGVQYVFRYRKYQVAEFEDKDSLAASKAPSSTTLLSDVISLTKMRPSRKNKHVRLRESMDCEQSEEAVALAGEEETSQCGSTTTLKALATLANPEEDITPTSSSPTSPRASQPIRRSSRSSEKDGSNEKDDCLSGSKAALTNVSDDDDEEEEEEEEGVVCSKSDPGCYSSVASMVSTATIRSTNAKATKDKKNREKLLAGPTGSEFSLVNDLEIDYYDYNVINAGAAPGSYLGMDPAFLVWIPPLDESGEILPEAEESLEMTDIRPKVFIDPGSNKESPEEETLLPQSKLRRRSVSESTTSPLSKKRVRKVVHPLVHGPTLDNRYKTDHPPPRMETKKSIKLAKETRRSLSPDVEKETKVEKSRGVDEIRFADDDEELDFNEMQPVDAN